jgi:diaminopimelate epimerase
VQFAFDMGIKKDSYHFIAVDGPHDAVIRDGLVRLKMQDVHQLEIRGDVKILNTGSPHYIQPVNDLHTMDVVSEGKKIRYNEEFYASGINVNFVCPTEEGIRVRTYERGVEDETLSCGTGVTAACLSHASENRVQEIKVKVQGGNLSVSFNRISNQDFEDIWLVGPATFVFKGQYII